MLHSRQRNPHTRCGPVAEENTAMSSPLFTKLHYEWLARWVGENLTVQQYYALSDELNNTNANFNANEFIRACDRAAAGGKVVSP